MFKKKSPLKNSRLVKRKRRIFYLKVSGSILAVIIFIVGLSLLSKISAFALTDIEIKGNATIEASVIKSVVNNHISGNYLYLFSRSNKYLYPKNAIAEDISQHIQKIEDVSVATSGHELTVSITERKPAYTWCTGMPAESDNRHCYFIDQDGYIFSESPLFSGDAFFAFYGMVTAENPIGSTFLNGPQFKELDMLVEFLNTHNAMPYALLAKDNGVFEVYFEKGGKLIFKSDQDTKVLISNIDLLLKNTKLFPKTNSTLEYIDMRFGNKIYYKMTGDNTVQPVEHSGV